MDDYALQLRLLVIIPSFLIYLFRIVQVLKQLISQYLIVRMVVYYRQKLHMHSSVHLMQMIMLSKFLYYNEVADILSNTCVIWEYFFHGSRQ